MEQLISIIVPIYNVENYLRRCLDSILRQTYKKLEIILVDDGSPDGSGEICNEYAKKDERIKVIHKENGGVSDARNCGVEAATGEYITFVDPDDLVTEDYVEYMYNILTQTNSDMSITEEQIVWKDIKEEKESEITLKQITPEQAFENILFAQGIELGVYAKLYKSELLKSVKFPKGKVYEDTAILYQVIDKAPKIAYGNKRNYCYIARPYSISKMPGYNKNEDDYIEHTWKMLEYIQEKYPKLETAVHRFDVYARFRILRRLIFTKPRNKKMEKEYVEKIKEYQKEVFTCDKTPKRDKIAIILLNMGLPIFKLTWLIYCKVTKRIG